MQFFFTLQGVLAEILEPIMGKGLIPADPETWSVRRRQIVPAFHKVSYLMTEIVFSTCRFSDVVLSL